MPWAPGSRPTRWTLSVSKTCTKSSSSTGSRELVKLFYDKAEATRKELPDDKKTEFLFLCNDVYTYKLVEEWTISAFYTGVRDIRPETLRLFRHGTDMRCFDGLVRNMRFYDFLIPVQKIINVSTTRTFFSAPRPRRSLRSRTAISSTSGSLITDTTTPYPNIIRVRLDADLMEQSRAVLYLGVEDVRLFPFPDGTVRFLGTGYHQNDTLGVVTGVYPTDLNSVTELTQKFNPGTHCEKNWVHVLPRGETEPRIIYGWHPIRLCRRDDNEIATPPLFASLRGSTNGCVEVWFVVHFVEYTTPRRYYHMVLVLDDAMTEIKRVTAPFLFENQNIEYCLGLVVEPSRLIFSYSTWDETSKIAIVDRASMKLWDSN